MDQDGNTWQSMPMTDQLWDALALRGLSTPRNKKADAGTIVGHEFADDLEKAEFEARLKATGFQVRADDGLDPAALILKDQHVPGQPGVNPVSLLIESDNYQVALNLIQPLFENALSNIIQSQMDPQQIIAEAGQIAASAAPLKENALSVIAEASKLAKARLLATSRAVNPQELERASVMLVEYLTKTHFAQRAIRADEDSGDVMTATQKRMLALIEPGIQQVPEDTAAHLAELVESVVTEIVDGNQAVPMEERTMRIPDAEYRNQRSDHNVTPSLRAMLRRNEGLDRAVRPAPLVNRRVPVSPRGLDLAGIVAQALAPIVADVAALKARGGASVTRAAHRRALTTPQVSRAAVQSAMGGGAPVVTRSVASSMHGGLPTRRQVFSPAQIARRSTGLGLTERSSAPRRPNAFPSRYIPSSVLATPEARDHFDSQFENRPVGVRTPQNPGHVVF